MPERRETSRVELNHPITLQIEDQRVRGMLRNLSLQGALVALTEQDADEMDVDLLGLDATFVIRPKGQGARKYTGELIRFFFKDDIPYAALRFWKPYQELP